ncbi:MAG TPA: DUF3995 domain-containing protein [Kribbella sp.]|nr:DUF3995 domain-containing protein [Kribbella sp.]
MKKQVAAAVACVLGLGHAAFSAYWALGGTGLLDTIGGSLEEWGRRREPALIAALWVIVVLKVVVAAAAPVLQSRRLPAWTRGRVPRILSWIAAVFLVLYGGLLTTGGLLIESGVLASAADADQRALAWHAYFWDPWFLLWGMAFALSLWWSRAESPDVVERSAQARDPR